MSNRFRVVSAALAVAATVTALAGCAFIGPPQKFADEFSVSDRITAIELDSSSGRITVVGSPDANEVRVERTLWYHGDRPTADTHRVSGGTLELGGCGRWCSVDYTVQAPEGVEVRGRTSNGAVELTAVGDVDVRTSNGRVELQDVSGRVDVETSNGRITGRDLNGDGVRAQTSNGVIELQVGTAQDVEARTSNGAIDVRVPKSTYRVTAETSNGRTDVGVADDPEGRFELDLHTSNGSITVTEG